MRILHILNTGRYSGAENVVITLIHALEGTAECAYVSPDGPIRKILEENRIAFYPVSTKATNAKDLKRIIAEFKPDVLHTHDYNAGIMAVLTGTKLPIINHLHNNTPWLKTLGIKSFVYGLSCLRYQKIFTVSDSVMDEFVFGERFRKKSEMVGNPINLSRIRQKADEAIDESLASKAKTDIAFLGRLSPQKNIFFLLEILREVKKVLPSVSLSVIGTGELREEFEAKIVELDLSENVVQFGFQSNPYPLLKQAKIMCMPSKWEGFGLAAVEALSLGVPVVAAKVGGLQTIINDACGKLCNTKMEYVDEILHLLSDENYYNSKVRGAICRADEYDNLKTYKDVMVNTYTELSSSKVVK